MQPKLCAAASERGWVVTNSSTVYAEPCAQHVFAFMLANSRRLPAGLVTRCANGSPAWLQLRTTSTLLRDQSVVLLGFGSIARKLVEMMRPFGMRIVAFRRRPGATRGSKWSRKTAFRKPWHRPITC